MDVDSDSLSSGRVITPQGSHLKVLQSFKNIGPVNDALLVDLEGSGQVCFLFHAPIQMLIGNPD